MDLLCHSCLTYGDENPKDFSEEEKIAFDANPPKAVTMHKGTAYCRSCASTAVTWEVDEIKEVREFTSKVEALLTLLLEK